MSEIFLFTSKLRHFADKSGVLHKYDGYCMNKRFKVFDLQFPFELIHEVQQYTPRVTYSWRRSRTSDLSLSNSESKSDLSLFRVSVICRKRRSSLTYISGRLESYLTVICRN